MTKRHCSITLFDGTNNCGLTYQDYCDFCELNDIPVTGKDSYEYNMWLQDTIDDNFYDFIRYDITNEEFKSNVVVCGTLGLWNGRHEICPKVFTNAADAVRRCIEKCDICKVIFCDGVLFVQAYHHDGVNTFQIYSLSKKGNDYYHRHNEISEVKAYMLKKFKTIF